MNQVDTIVLGAGISGLTAAHYLNKKGLNFLLIETSNRPGGVIHTKNIGNYRIEQGPNSIMLNEDVQALINEIDIADKVLTAPGVEENRYIYFRGKLALAKPGFELLKSRLLTFKSIIAFLKEPFQKPSIQDDESIAEFFIRRLNKEILDNLINPMVSGIYAGDPAKLSLRSTFKKLYSMEKEYGSLIKAAIKKRKEKRFKRILTSFQGGLSTFTQGLADQFTNKTWFGTQVNSVTSKGEGYNVTLTRNNENITLKCRRVISTISASTVAEVFTELDESAISSLKNIYYAPMLLLYLAYNKKDIPFSPDGFGFLIPQKEKMPFLGAIWNSALFPQVAPQNQLLNTVFVGGTNNLDVIDNAEEQAEIAGKSFARVMGAPEIPVFKHYYLKKRAIPQFHVGYYKVQEAIDVFEQYNPGLYISGNWRSGVAIGDCVSYNKKLINNNL